MILVLDASAAVRAVLEPAGEEGREPLAAADLVVAPSLFAAETANAFWKYCKAGLLDREGAEAGLRNALGLVDEFREIDVLAIEAWQTGLLLERPVYDCFYLVLARRLGARLHKADQGLRKAAGRLGIAVTGAGS